MKTGWKGRDTANPNDTINLGGELSNYIEKGDLFCMVGEIASGKTTFIKGILRGLKYTKPVTSPTFTLINEYNAKYPVIHIDCYRESNLDRWIKVGLNDYINGENIVLIEWGDKMQSILPDDCIQIHFSHLGVENRQILLKKS